MHELDGKYKTPPSMTMAKKAHNITPWLRAQALSRHRFANSPTICPVFQGSHACVLMPRSKVTMEDSRQCRLIREHRCPSFDVPAPYKTEPTNDYTGRREDLDLKHRRITKVGTQAYRVIKECIRSNASPMCFGP